MKAISEQRLEAAVSRAGLPPEVFDRILAALACEPQAVAAFEVAHLAYYLGGLLIIGAMGWFITTAWNSLPGAALTGVALLYAAVFGGTGAFLFKRPATRVPAGVLITVAVCMTPLAVYGIERQLGWWPGLDPGAYSRFHPYINAGWVVMELMTVMCSAFAVFYARFAFITAPAAYALWYLSMDATALVFGRHWTFHQECMISVAFGVVMLVAAYLLENRSEIDLPFWFYLFGLLTFTGGLTVMGGGSQINKAIYCALHAVLIGLSLVLQRRVFLVFGALGVFAYLVGEAEGYFRNSLAFTASLTILGMLFIALGLAYKRHEADLTRNLHLLIPERIRHRHLAA